MGSPPCQLSGAAGTVHIFEQGFGVVPGKRQSHDFRRGLCLLDRNALGARNRGPARGLRIAGDDEVVSDGAALDVIFRTPGAVGIDLAFFIAVFGGITVNQNCGGAFALGGERFESAIAVGIGVAHEDDFVFDADAVLTEQIVVFGIAAVGVDDGRGHFAGDRHAEPGAADSGIFRVVIAGERGFAETGLIMGGGDHFERGGFGIGAVHVVAADDDVFEALLSPFVANVFGEFVVALRSGDVGLGVKMRCWRRSSSGLGRDLNLDSISASCAAGRE